MSQVFKTLEPSNIQVRSFIAKKAWSYSNTDVSSSVAVYKGYRPTGSAKIFADTLPTTSLGEYEHIIFASVDHLYYAYKENAFNTFGIYADNRIHKNLQDSCSIFSVSRTRYGQKVSSGSFSIEQGGNTIKDDGYGNLYNLADEANFVLSKSDYTVGNIFYEHGLAVITSQSTFYQNFATSSYIVKFKGEHRIYEYEVNCEIEGDEFNFTTNPSILVSGSQVVGNIPGFASRSIFYNEVTASIVSSSYWTPYITTVGLYDEFNNLVAIGKLSRPLKNEKHMTKTVVVRIDL